MYVIAAVFVGVLVTVGVWVGVFVIVDVGVWVGVSVEVCVGVWVLVGVNEAVGVVGTYPKQPTVLHSSTTSIDSNVLKFPVTTVSESTYVKQLLSSLKTE